MRLLWVVSKTQSQGQAYLFSTEFCFGVRFGVLQKKKKRLTVALAPAPAPAQFVHILEKLTLTLLSKLSALSQQTTSVKLDPCEDLCCQARDWKFTPILTKICMTHTIHTVRDIYWVLSLPGSVAMRIQEWAFRRTFFLDLFVCLPFDKKNHFKTLTLAFPGAY